MFKWGHSNLPECRKTCMIWLHNCKGCVTFLQQTHFINVNNKISSRQSIEKEEDAFLKAAISQVFSTKTYSTYNVLCQLCVDVLKFYKKKLQTTWNTIHLLREYKKKMGLTKKLLVNWNTKQWLLRVQPFWEGHQSLHNISHGFDIY